MKKSLFSIACIAAFSAAAGAADDSWLQWSSPALRQVVRRQAAAQSELSALGMDLAGQTVAQFGYLHPRLAAPPPTSPWIQLDLQTAQRLDWIALVPAELDWQAGDHEAYGFPPRFRVDLSDDPTFATFAPVAVLTEADFPDPGNAPVAFRVGGRKARYVRVTVTKLAVENGQYFFALAELMVLAGTRDIAIGRTVRTSASMELPPRWARENLVDGRTPLGPPVRRELLPYDGLYAGDGGGAKLPEMRLDLGRRAELQEVRLHPIHARLGADIPGYAFPARFRVEAADDPAFVHPTVLLDASAADFPNPGNNPVTIPVSSAVARYVRVVMLAPAAGMQLRRFGLSEIEVYSQGVNIARTASVTATPYPLPENSSAKPPGLLVDGFTSYGRLMELPEWLASWQRRTALRDELAGLGRDRSALDTAARRRVFGLAAAAALAGAAAAVAAVVLVRRGRERELERFRTRLAHDLHDEIGSNLAGLAVLSETAADHAPAAASQRDDWLEVNRIARESTDAMREVLWLVGARQETGIDLGAHLRLAAARMLPNREVRWSGEDPLPAGWSADTRRQVFLFFKEALANVSRHSRAAAVELSLRQSGEGFELSIADNGRGFDPETAPAGVGLNSLRARARAVGGQCVIDTALGQGTRLTLRVPKGAA